MAFICSINFLHMSWVNERKLDSLAAVLKEETQQQILLAFALFGFAIEQTEGPSQNCGCCEIEWRGQSYT